MIDMDCRTESEDARFRHKGLGARSSVVKREANRTI